MNDPFDCDLNLLDYEIYSSSYSEVIKRLWKKGRHFEEEYNYASIIHQIGNAPDQINRVLPEIVKIFIRKSSGVTCFSERNESILMWSHYASNHRGVCLGFDFENFESLVSLPNKERSVQIMFGKVIYDNEPERLNFFENEDRAIEQVITHKAKDWSYEDEWRIFSRAYVGLLNFKKICLRKIVFGMGISDYQKKEVIEIVHRSQYQNIEFFNAIGEKGQFKIRLNRMSDETIRNYLVEEGWSTDYNLRYW